MIAIVDYGMGNLRSVEKAVQRVGGKAAIVVEPDVVQNADAVILPGVGAFGDAMQNLRDRQLVDALVNHIHSGKPFLGICLGMHLLFEESEEMGRHEGLGVLSGRVVRFPVGGLKVPHVGWNQLQIQRPSPLLTGVADGSYTYFVHSYHVVPKQESVIVATTEYGLPYASVVGQANLLGVQFHPEKSQEIGLTILGNFVTLVSRRAGDLSGQGN